VGGGKEAFAWTIISEGVNLTLYGVRRKFYLHLIGFILFVMVAILPFVS